MPEFDVRRIPELAGRRWPVSQSGNSDTVNHPIERADRITEPVDFLRCEIGPREDAGLVESVSQLYHTIREAIDELPEIYRQTLTLYYLGGLNSTEIARFLGT